MMAISKLTYDDKVDYISESTVENKHKITAEDMNAIKSIINKMAECMNTGILFVIGSGDGYIEIGTIDEFEEKLANTNNESEVST